MKPLSIVQLLQMIPDDAAAEKLFAQIPVA